MSLLDRMSDEKIDALLHAARLLKQLAPAFWGALSAREKRLITDMFRADCGTASSISRYEVERRRAAKAPAETT